MKNRRLLIIAATIMVFVTGCGKSESIDKYKGTVMGNKPTSNLRNNDVDSTEDAVEAVFNENID